MNECGMLAIHLGTGCCRLTWGLWKPDGLETIEVHRFDHIPVQRDGLMNWNIPGLVEEIKQGIHNCILNDLPFSTVGLCSWGNDHFLWSQKQISPIENREKLPQTDDARIIPDLLNEMLCGKLVSEETIAETRGTVLGSLDDRFLSGWKWPEKPVVVAVSGNDMTSVSGIVHSSVPEDSLYLNCDLWSCMGCSTDAANPGKALYEADVTCDSGSYQGHQLRLYHNGLWILQECRKQWASEGFVYTDAEIDRLAANRPQIESVIDSEDEGFFRAGNMPQKINAFLKKTGQKLPTDHRETVWIILQSLALCYRFSVDKLSRLSGISFRSMQLMGEGSCNRLLCQLTADACKLLTFAGPNDGATLGNFFQQGLAAKQLANREDGLKRLYRQDNLQLYTPEFQPKWDYLYEKSLLLFHWRLPEP